VLRRRHRYGIHNVGHVLVQWMWVFVTYTLAFSFITLAAMTLPMTTPPVPPEAGGRIPS